MTPEEIDALLTHLPSSEEMATYVANELARLSCDVDKLHTQLHKWAADYNDRLDCQKDEESLIRLFHNFCVMTMSVLGWHACGIDSIVRQAVKMPPELQEIFQGLFAQMIRDCGSFQHVRVDISNAS